MPLNTLLLEKIGIDCPTVDKKYVSKMQLFAFEFSRALAFGIIKLPLNVDFSQNGASPVQELPSENLSAIIGTLAPQLAPEDIKSAARLGPSHSSRPRDETSGSLAGAKPAPRLVRVVLSPQGKNLLLRNKTSAQYKGDNVYIQHDLTRQEQRRRKDLVPKFRALRDKGVRCHLPRDKIINNGAPLSSDDITRLLNTVTQ